MRRLLSLALCLLSAVLLLGPAHLAAAEVSVVFSGHVIEDDLDDLLFYDIFGWSYAPDSRENHTDADDRRTMKFAQACIGSFFIVRKDSTVGGWGQATFAQIDPQGQVRLVVPPLRVLYGSDVLGGPFYLEGAQREAGKLVSCYAVLQRGVLGRADLAQLALHRVEVEGDGTVHVTVAQTLLQSP